MTTVCRLGCEMIKALRAVHEMGVLHRDVKPSNFVLVVATKQLKIPLLQTSCISLILVSPESMLVLMVKLNLLAQMQVSVVQHVMPVSTVTSVKNLLLVMIYGAFFT